MKFSARRSTQRSVAVIKSEELSSFRPGAEGDQVAGALEPSVMTVRNVLFVDTNELPFSLLLSFLFRQLYSFPGEL